MNAYEMISQFCGNEGITEFGIAAADPFYNIEGIQNIEFCEKDINKRIYPCHTLNGAKSFICLLFPYKRADGSEACVTGKMKGKISSGDVWLGEDYHVYVLRKLKKLCGLLEDSFSGRCMPFCDTGPFVDKEIAVRAGICGYARNNLAINKKLGTFFYIGYILTDLYIENASMNIRNSLSECCDGCRICVNACPARALGADGAFDRTKCVSYLTQKKGELTEEEEAVLGDNLYGCLICQNACPYNAKTGFVKYVELSKYIGLSNKEFRECFRNTAAGFIGKKLFLRNSAAIMRNAEKRG